MHKKISHKICFTLVEVLITLVIIGVVAAVTIPNVISNYRKHVVENKLKNFYAIMNQAVKFSEAEYGDFGYWVSFEGGNGAAIETWWNKYFAPHIKTLKTETRGANLIVYLADGTKLQIFNYGAGKITQAIHIYFYPNSNSVSGRDIMGKTYFSFFMNSTTNKKSAAIEPYKFSWDGTEYALKYANSYGCYTSSCPHYCTALIQFNKWKIPKDYPYKF